MYMEEVGYTDSHCRQSEKEKNEIEIIFCLFSTFFFFFFFMQKKRWVATTCLTLIFNTCLQTHAHVLQQYFYMCTCTQTTFTCAHVHFHMHMYVHKVSLQHFSKREANALVTHFKRLDTKYQTHKIPPPPKVTYPTVKQNDLLDFYVS